MRRRDILAGAIAALAGTAIPCLAAADGGYPKQPIRLIVPRSAGGVVDIVARLWAEQATERLGNIVVENQGGGGGVIGASSVAHAKPDGYTLLAGTTSELVITPAITPNPPYDPLRDLVPISLLAESVSALMVHASLPVHTPQELVAYDRGHPGTLVYGSAGVGTSAHLCAELFKQLAGLHDIVHVPYRGANSGLTDFYAGRLPLFAASISPQVLAMHNNGTIRILVAGTDHRLRAAPTIPIGSEVGFPELITVQFIGLFAPRGTPEPIIKTVAAISHEALMKPDVQQRLVADGFEPLTNSGPGKAADFVRDEQLRWAPVLKASGISGG